MNGEQSWKSEGPTTGRWLKQLKGSDDTCCFLHSVDQSFSNDAPSVVSSLICKYSIV